MAKQKSRVTRWMEACDKMREGLNELLSVREEYEDWRDNIPENLQGSALYEKLETVCDIDLDTIEDVISECEGTDLPLGFGRD